MEVRLIKLLRVPRGFQLFLIPLVPSLAPAQSEGADPKEGSGWKKEASAYAVAHV